MSLIKKVKNKLGNIIYPETLTKAVYDEDGNRLDITLDQINARTLSHVGMVIHSTTLDTEDKVKAIYGGTTWTPIEGRFLLGKSDSYAINSEGGEATHTLTTNEMPKHDHTARYLVSTSGSSVGWIGNTGTFNESIKTGYSGGSQPHNNMPPYKTVYIWERTA